MVAKRRSFLPGWYVKTHGSMIQTKPMSRVHRQIRRVLALLALLTTAEVGAVEFAPVFNDGTVLQADLPVNI